MSAPLHPTARLSAILLSLASLSLAWPARVASPLSAAIALRPAAARLVAAAPVSRQISTGESNVYVIPLTAGQAIHAAVERHGIETSISLTSPAGQPILALDSPDWIEGREELFAVAGSAGDYRLTVADRSGAGSYRLLVDPPRPAGERDRRREKAERALSEADRLRGRRQLDHAADAYRQAMAGSRRAGLPQQEAIARYSLGAALEDAGRNADALRVYRKLLAGWGRSREGDAALNAIGRCYVALGLAEEARDAFRRAELQARSLGDRAGHAAALTNVARLDRERDFQLALDRLAEARDEFRALGLLQQEATALLDIGQVHYSLGAWDQAIDAGSKALDLQRRTGGRGAVVSLQLLGAAYTEQEQWRLASDRFGETRALAREQGEPEFELAATAGLGCVYLQQGQVERTINLLEESLRRAPRRGDRSSEANALGVLGAAYARRGKGARALDCFARARAIYRKLKKPEEEASILFGEAQALELAGSPERARRAIEASIDTVERLRTGAAGSDLRAAFFASRQSYHELYVRVLMELDNRHPSRGFDQLAFEASERTRARTQLDELAASHLDVHTGADPALISREDALAHRLEEATSPDTGDRLQGLEAEIRRLSSDLEAVRGKMRRNNLRYAALTEPAPLSLREIQSRVLDERTLLLAYSLGEKKSFLWTIGHASFHVYPLPPRSQIEELTKRTYDCLATSHRGRCASEVWDDLTKLSRLVLAPAAAELGDRRLLVVADGALQYIPFAVLPEPSSQGAASERSPLLQAHEIVHLSSASLVPMLRRESGRPPAPKLVAVLADPVFERDDSRFGGKGGAPQAAEPGGDAERAAHDLGLHRLARLPHTREEADAIVALAPRALALEATGFAASRALAVSPELRAYRVLHFATHGFLNARNPELSGIVLSRYDAQGRRQNEFLHAYDVYGLKLSADLVVLSACQTALGAEVRGEGLMGLTRGFMYAGAPRVLVSLWDINDRATAELMAHFYRGILERKLRPAAALREAQLETAKRYPSPYYWAAFELQGDWR